MKQYLKLLQTVLENGNDSPDRTGINVKSIFGVQTRYDLSQGFPLITTKKMPLRIIFIELIRMIRGESNIKYLVDRNCHIWNEWPFQNYLKHNSLDKKFEKYTQEWKKEMEKFIEKIKNSSPESDFVKKWGDLGPVYGKQRRNFNNQNIDQLQNAILQIKNNPHSRRIIVSAWNPIEIENMLLPPCHSFFQFHINTQKNSLDLQLYQRSGDLFLGVPFNIASYSLLLIFIAKITGKIPGDFIHTIGDAHIYNNHKNQVIQQLKNIPFSLPQIKINKELQTIQDIEELEWQDIVLLNYQSHEKISAPVAV